MAVHDSGGGVGVGSSEPQVSRSVDVTSWLGTLWKSLSSQNAALSSQNAALSTANKAPFTAPPAVLHQPPPHSVPAFCEYCSRRRSDELCPHYGDPKPAAHFLPPPSQQDGGALASTLRSLRMVQHALGDASSSLPQ